MADVDTDKNEKDQFESADPVSHYLRHGAIDDNKVDALGHSLLSEDASDEDYLVQNGSDVALKVPSILRLIIFFSVL